MSAVQAAKRSRVAMEMHQISLALETYKNKFGEYPPDLYDKQAVVRHVKKRWPRFQLVGSDQYLAFMTVIENVYRHNLGTTIHYYDDSTSSTTITREASYVGALPLWLGGFPNSDGKFSGFSADPEAPFGKGQGKDSSLGDTSFLTKINNGNTNVTWDTNTIRLGTQDKDSVFYEMIIGKNIMLVTTAVDGSKSKPAITFPVLVNRDATANKDGSTPVPYVYFKSNSSIGGKMAYLYLIDNIGPYADSEFDSNGSIYKPKCYGFTTVFSGTGSWSELGLISAYARSGDPSNDNPSIIWQEPERFQLIHPGLDGVFGNGIKQNLVLLNATDPYPKLKPNYFRSIDTNITTNDIGQKDFDNLTNFSDYQQIKSILP
jgi:hypothetical protein